MRSSAIMIPPPALIAARYTPRPGTCMIRSPSRPGLGSSVTSNRSIGHWARAFAISAPTPGSAVQARSARMVPRSASCGAHPSLTVADPRTRPIAHSTCGHTAGGLEWM